MASASVSFPNSVYKSSEIEKRVRQGEQTGDKNEYTSCPLNRALRIFGYLKAHSRLSIIIDASDHIVRTTNTPLNDVNWDEQYPVQFQD